ncbi:MAG: DUF1648 domain-containing protein [Dehalococcoidia bacterium]|nr:DUF1648 domain-containing protein [Dehalococcoidia bacterium]
MRLNKYSVMVLAIILAFFIIAMVFYPRMPDRMASHWNAAGEAGGYMSSS